MENRQRRILRNGFILDKYMRKEFSKGHKWNNAEYLDWVGYMNDNEFNLYYLKFKKTTKWKSNL